MASVAGSNMYHLIWTSLKNIRAPRHMHRAASRLLRAEWYTAEKCNREHKVQTGLTWGGKYHKIFPRGGDIQIVFWKMNRSFAYGQREKGSLDSENSRYTGTDRWQRGMAGMSSSADPRSRGKARRRVKCGKLCLSWIGAKETKRRKDSIKSAFWIGHLIETRTLKNDSQINFKLRENMQVHSTPFVAQIPTTNHPARAPLVCHPAVIYLSTHTLTCDH